MLDEVLAQVGEHLLAEHLADVAGVAGQHALGEQEAAQQDRGAVDDVGGRAVLHGLDEVAEQPGRGEGGDGGQRVQQQRAAEDAGVAPGEHHGVAPQGLRARDGEGAHRRLASSRTTASR